jgi:hypothetical protein
MPGGGPDASDLPDEILATAAAAISWAATLAHYPPAWLALHPSQAAFLLAVCGVRPNFHTPAFWSDQVLPLRLRFLDAAVRPIIFSLRPGDTHRVSGGDTLLIAPHAQLLERDPLFFQSRCDELAISLPYDFEAVLAAASTIYTSWPVDPSWPEWISPRELVASHAWVKAVSTAPSSPSDPNWNPIPEEHTTTLMRALGVGQAQAHSLSRQDKHALLIRLSREHHGVPHHLR